MREVNRNVVLAVGSVMQLFLGIIYIFSIFVVPVSEYFGMDAADVKLTSSFMLCFFVIGILFGGKLQLKITTQRTVLIGGLLLAVAMFSSSLLPKDLGMLIYFTYGIVGGFGVGMGYNSIITTAQRNFPDKRGLATGISVCTFGFSTVIFAPLAENLVRMIGLQTTFVVLGTVFAVATLCCFSFIKLPSMTTAAASTAVTERDFSQSEMLKSRIFYMITGAMMLGTTVYFIMNPSFKSLALERGLSDSMATIMIMLTGISNALGRLVFPAISDRTNRSFACFLTVAITAVGAFCMLFAQGYFLILIVNLVAFCYGGTAGSFPLITGKFFGLANIGSNYGCIMVGFSISALLAPILLSPIQNQMVLFSIVGVFAVIASVLLLMLVKVEKKS